MHTLSEPYRQTVRQQVAPTRLTRISAGPFTFLAAALTVAALAVDGRISVGANVLFAEICLAAFAVLAIFSKGRVSISSSTALVALIWASVSALALTLSDAPDITITSVRNITSALLMMMALKSARPSPEQIVKLYRVLSYTGAAIALLGIHQSFAGYYNSITLDSLGLKPDLLEAKYGIAAILRWKLNAIHSSGIGLYQKNLAIGLFTFSNDLGEYLVYTSIATLGLRRLRAINSFVFVTIMFLVLCAIFLSQSRTSMIGAAIVIGYHLYKSSRDGYRKLIATGSVVMVFAIVPMLIANFMKYDSFGTLSGRIFLDGGGIYAIVSSPKAMFFGGHLWRYYDAYLQDPHSFAIYMALYYGIPFSIAAMLFVLALMRRCFRLSRLLTGRLERSIAECGSVASIWFIGYGLTWSVVGSAISGMLWALFVGSALSIPVPQRVSERGKMRGVPSSPEGGYG